MIQRKIKTKLIGKEEVFKILALGEATKLPVLLLGEPGVGKTQGLLDYAAAKYNYNIKEVKNKTFILELDEGTKTSEVKGRVNMKSLLENKEYKLDTPIADAEYILINEVDKGTSGVRNTLLSIMREKALFHGNEIIKCHWEIFAGSCNTIPDDEIENPFWDRFVLTYKVDRVGLTNVTDIWKTAKLGQELDISIPTLEEVENVKINKGKTMKFLECIYNDISDRTSSFLPLLIKGIKLIYKLDDVESIIKCCEFIAPTKLSELISKLETKREASVRAQINSLKGVLEGDDTSYCKVFLIQILDELEGMSKMNTYKTKTEVLLKDIVKILDMAKDDNDITNELFEILQQAMTDKVNNFDKHYELWEI